MSRFACTSKHYLYLVVYSILASWSIGALQSGYIIKAGHLTGWATGGCGHSLAHNLTWHKHSSISIVVVRVQMATVTVAHYDLLCSHASGELQYMSHALSLRTFCFRNILPIWLKDILFVKCFWESIFL